MPLFSSSFLQKVEKYFRQETCSVNFLFNGEATPGRNGLLRDKDHLEIWEKKHNPLPKPEESMTPKGARRTIAPSILESQAWFSFVAC